MAAPIAYAIAINPTIDTTPSTDIDGGYDNSVILSVVNRNALVLFINEIKAGTDVSSVVTAINAL